MVSLNENPITRHYTVRLFLSSIILTSSSANFAFDNQGFSQVHLNGYCSLHYPS